jgi:hypothetical protein
MAKKPINLRVTLAVDAPYELPSGAALREVFDTDESALTNRKLQEIAGLLWHEEGATEEGITVRLVCVWNSSRASHLPTAQRGCWRSRWWAHMMLN